MRETIIQSPALLCAWCSALLPTAAFAEERERKNRLFAAVKRPARRTT